MDGESHWFMSLVPPPSPLLTPKGKHRQVLFKPHILTLQAALTPHSSLGCARHGDTVSWRGKGATARQQLQSLRKERTPHPIAGFWGWMLPWRARQPAPATRTDSTWGEGGAAVGMEPSRQGKASTQSWSSQEPEMKWSRNPAGALPGPRPARSPAQHRYPWSQQGGSALPRGGGKVDVQRG